MHVLHTKLSLPIANKQTAIPRLSLLQEIVGYHQKSMLFIHAAAGYGKTTLMRQIALEQSALGTNIHWLTLDEDDNDPLRLYQYLWYAFNGELPQISFGDGVITKHSIYLLIEKINQSEQQKILFIDDLERLENIDSLNVIWWLYLNLPAHCQLILASRIRPTWSFTKEILDGRIQLLTEEQLSLKETESDIDNLVTFFQHQNPKITPISRVIAQQLISKTEGWITGIQLASIYAKDNSEMENFIQTLSGAHNQIVDYLNEQVFLQQSTEIQFFLMQISILRKVNLPLIKALTRNHSAQQILELMNQKGLFIQAIDEQRIWYRIHHLFRDFLVSRFQLLHPEKFQQLHMEAAEWYKRNRDIMEAIYHAQQVHDIELMAALLDDVSRELVLEGRLYTLLEFAKQLPEPVIVGYPALLYNVIWALLLTHQSALANHYLQLWHSIDQNEALLAEDDQLGLAPLVAILEDRLADAYELASHNLKSLPVTSYFARGPLIGIGVLYHICAGKMTEARKLIVETRIINVQGRNLYGLVLVDCIDAVCDYLVGNLDLAEQKFRQIGNSDEYKQLGLDESNRPAITAILSSFKADLYYEMNQLSLAQEALEQFNGGIQLVMPDMVIVGYILKLRLIQLSKKPLASNRYKNEAQLKSSIWSLPRLAATLQNYQLEELQETNFTQPDLSIQNTKEQAASDLLNFTNLLRGDDLIPYRVQVLNGDTQSAILYLLAQQQIFTQYPLRQARLSLLLALAYLQENESQQALFELKQALEIMMQTRAIRMILDENPKIWGLITQLYKELQIQKQEKNIPLLEYIQYLFQIRQPDFEQEQNLTQNFTLLKSEIDQFSKRELQILSKVGEGLTDAEIADEIFLSINTIKWHLRNIYTKLMVRSRLEAVKKAKKKGLIV